MNKLEKFTQRLRDAGLSERQIDEVVFALNEYNNARLADMTPQQDKEDVDDEIAIHWHIEDVRSLIEDRSLNIDLTDDQCREVLQLAKHNHDATTGISWDVLEVWVNQVAQQGSKEDSEHR